MLPWSQLYLSTPTGLSCTFIPETYSGKNISQKKNLLIVAIKIKFLLKVYLQQAIMNHIDCWLNNTIQPNVEFNQLRHYQTQILTCIRRKIASLKAMVRLLNY